MVISTLRTSLPIIFSTQTTGIHTEVNRLLAAAVVNKQFRQLLLSDPVQALDIGCQGEKFAFSRIERDLIFSIQANSLHELAGHLISSLGISPSSNQHHFKPEIQPSFKTN